MKSFLVNALILSVFISCQGNKKENPTTESEIVNPKKILNKS
jgi:hypothetical protein